MSSEAYTSPHSAADEVSSFGEEIMSSLFYDLILSLAKILEV